MWKRFTRLIKSMFGGAISAMEDPRLILEQNMRELNDQVPKMNENIATVKANVMLLQKENRKYEKEEQTLTARIKAAIQAGRDDIAQRYAVQLQQVKEAVCAQKNEPDVDTLRLLHDHEPLEDEEATVEELGLSEETVVMFSAQSPGQARERRLAREEARQNAKEAEREAREEVEREAALRWGCEHHHLRGLGFVAPSSPPCPVGLH